MLLTDTKYVIILSDKYLLSLPVGGFIALISSTQPTCQKRGRVAAGCEKQNNICQIK
jgi:hypothetical protein